jgi:hypothetical protein
LLGAAERSVLVALVGMGAEKLHLVSSAIQR